MKKIIMSFLIIFGLVLMAMNTSLQAQATKYGQAGMTFLKIDVGGRTAGMGGTSVGVVNDASSMFSNPAGLAGISGLDILLNQTNWIVDIKQYAGAAAYGLGNWGTFGVSFINMDYGTFTETWPYEGFDPELMDKGYIKGNDFTVGEYALGVAYARQMTNKFSIGGQIKFVKQDLYKTLIWSEFQGKQIWVNNTLGVMAMDFGTLYYTGFKDLRFGMSMRNFSRQARYALQRFDLPLTFRIGLAMDVLTLFEDGKSNNHLTLAVDALHPRDYDERLQVGAEYTFMDILSVRAGYKFRYDEESFSAGFGVKKYFGNVGVRLDYAYSNFGKFFGSVHRLSWDFYYK